jgi:hypothetical protein
VSYSGLCIAVSSAKNFYTFFPIFRTRKFIFRRELLGQLHFVVFLAGQGFSLLTTISSPVLGLTHPPMGNEGSFPRVKVAGA